MSHDLLRYDIETRVRLLVAELTKGRSDWLWLEEETGISAEKWRNLNREKIKASVEMVEALCARWPQYAFWLATGVTDENHGHHAPQPYLGFPRLGDAKTEHDTIYTSHYFRECSRAIKRIWTWSMEQHQEWWNEKLSWKTLGVMFFQGFTLCVQRITPRLPEKLTTQILNAYLAKENEFKHKGGLGPTEVSEMPRERWRDLPVMEKQSAAPKTKKAKQNKTAS